MLLRILWDVNVILEANLKEDLEIAWDILIREKKMKQDKS